MAKPHRPTILLNNRQPTPCTNLHFDGDVNQTDFSLNAITSHGGLGADRQVGGGSGNGSGSSGGSGVVVAVVIVVVIDSGSGIYLPICE